VYVLPKNSGYQEIPTIQTTLEQAQGTLQRLIAKAEEADLPAMMTAASSAMKGIDRLVTSPNLHLAVDSLNGTERNLSNAAENLNRAAISLRILSDNLNSRIPPVMIALQGTANSARETMATTNRTLAALATTVEPASPVVYRMNKTLDDVSGAAHSIQELANYLQRNPSALIRGRYVDSK
jgi:paraquat-inducible protein B